MIDVQLKLVTEEFVRYLRSSQPIQEFLTVRGVLQDNPEVKKLREEYTSMAQKFQQKQSNSTLTQEDINAFRKIQTSLRTHPVTERYAQAHQTMVMMLQECNNAMGEVLGFDFAATAAPAASC